MQNVVIDLDHLSLFMTYSY